MHWKWMKLLVIIMLVTDNNNKRSEGKGYRIGGIKFLVMFVCHLWWRLCACILLLLFLSFSATPRPDLSSLGHTGEVFNVLWCCLPTWPSMWAFCSSIKMKFYFCPTLEGVFHFQTRFIVIGLTGKVYDVNVFTVLLA